jgi:hypothetical protein
MKMTKVEGKVEYGDFQTPRGLADSIVRFLRETGVSPSVVVEPTCGLGNFVLAATECFSSVRHVFAYDIRFDYISALREILGKAKGIHYRVAQQDFFTFNWKEFFSAFREEVLVIGNPPWVTNAALGVLGSDNLPEKTNFQNRSGFAAKTGKSNFDISEWMLIKLLESLDGKRGCVAMLCKTAVARKALRHGWVNRLNIGRATVHLIDPCAHFGVSVSACLLIVHTGVSSTDLTAGVYSDLTFNNKLTTFGLVGRELVADIDEYNRLRDLDGIAYYRWRSGVKHDAVSVMEFRKEDSIFVNGGGERVELEQTYIYPLLKSSDLANGRLTPQRYILVTQCRPGDDTEDISEAAPKTWYYLLRHASVLDRRQSIIYRRRPRFSIFGVGDYTFSPWKVAISGLYKNCRFEVAGEYQNKPVILDDTCYFIPCSSKEEASFACLLLNSEPAKRFLRALVFRDAKRPVTIDVLNRIDLKRVAEKLGLESDAREYLRDAALFEGRQRLLVFERRERYKTKACGGRSTPRG